MNDENLSEEIEEEEPVIYERRKEDREKKQMIISHRNDRRLWLAAFLIVIIATTVGFIRSDASDERSRDAAVKAEAAALEARKAAEAVEKETLERDYAQCVGQNEVRFGTLSFVEQLAGPEEAWSDRTREFISLARETFAPIECPPDPSP